MPDIVQTLEQQRAFFATGATRDVAFRAAQLRALQQAIQTHESEILEALRLDLNKAPFEAYETEVGIVLAEIRHTLRHLAKWAKPRRAGTPLMHFLSSSYVYNEPYGSVLVMSPWNYPFQLTIAPLVGAIAGGNCAVVKPSEYSLHTAQIMEKLLSGLFDASYVSVVRGGREANQDLLAQRFDYIFFTGSVAVGKVVMESAARYLTPVTLELGGKSPCIVDDTAQVDLAARRIVWGKFLNAGQTCVAPDYLLVHRDQKEALVQALRKYIRAFYGDDPLRSPDYPKIINRKHFDRLLGLMQGARVLQGGESDAEALRIAPAILDDVDWQSPVMREEIFGPLLPVLTFTDLAEALATVAQHPKPLAFYLFTTSKANKEHALRTASFGGGCINDAVIHLSNPNLPFGGVGESGMGQYHGKASYDTFTHAKGIIKKSNLLDVPLRYPPFKQHLRWLKFFMK